MTDIIRIINLCLNAKLKDLEHSDFVSMIELSFSLKVQTINDLNNITNFFDNLNNNMKIFLNKSILYLEILFIDNKSVEVIEFFQYHIFKDMSLLFSKVMCNVQFPNNNDTNIITVNNSMSEYKDCITRLKSGLSKNSVYIFKTEFANNAFDMMQLHICATICSKYKDLCKGFIIIVTDGELYRVSAFVNSILCRKVFVICRDYLVYSSLNSVGKLPPAVYIKNAVDLRFFQQPLRKNTWDKICYRQISRRNDSKYDVIGPDTFNSDEECESKFWPYLRLCQKYLFEEFDDNTSKAYTLLRRAAYSSEEFYCKYVSQIPFLALFVFAVYDNFYRSNLLMNFKKECGRKNYSLRVEDLVLSMQGLQDNKMFKKYEEIKHKYDIKNLVTEYNTDDFGKTTVVLHKSITAEVFECISISEGLLQILENAVIHANGGLLSLRVYSRAKGLDTNLAKKADHIEYLDSTYGTQYFHYTNSDFYLEVQLSDISDKSIPQKFIDNIETDPKRFDEIMKILSFDKMQYNAIKECINLSYFFTDNMNTIVKNVSGKFDANIKNARELLGQFRRAFYRVDKNLVHHYGLEIFNSIISSRDGIFSVCGYNEVYDNLDNVINKAYEEVDDFKSKYSGNVAYDELMQYMKGYVDHMRKNDIENVRKIIQKNKALPGTTYRILIPLNHNEAVSYNSSDSFTESDTKNDNKWVPMYFDYSKSYNIFQEIKSISNKQHNINLFHDMLKCSFYKELHDENRNEKTLVLCLNIPEILNKTGGVNGDANHFEEIIKGVLLFALETLKDEKVDILPIAIVNLNPFQLIEAARLISIYYTKRGSKSGGVFDRMPIYLKCINEANEVIFADSDVNEVQNRILKTAMKNGIMFDDLSTITDILKRVSMSEVTDDE